MKGAASTTLRADSGAASACAARSPWHWSGIPSGDCCMTSCCRAAWILRTCFGTSPTASASEAATESISGAWFRRPRCPGHHRPGSFRCFTAETGEIDWDSFFGKEGARWFHTGGIFCALSDSTPLVAREAMQAAKRSGAIISYDCNYRPSLWKSRGGRLAATAVNRELAPFVMCFWDMRATWPVNSPRQPAAYPFIRRRRTLRWRHG